MNNLNRKSFHEAYFGRSSQQMLANTETWLESARKCRQSKRLLSLNAVHNRKDFLTHTKYGAKAYDLILALDIMDRCLAAFAVHNLASLNFAQSGEFGIEGPQHAQLLASISLCNYLSQVSRAAFRLIVQGNDLGARILCRSISEASDYWLVMLDDADVAMRYLSSRDKFEDFWRANVRSEKLGRLRKKALRRLFSGADAEIDEACQYRDFQYRQLSEASHPSYNAGLMALIYSSPESECEPEWAFTKEWPHVPSAVFILDMLAPPILSACILSVLPQDNEASVAPPIEEARTEQPARIKKFVLDRRGIEAVMLGANLGISLATNYYELHGTPQAP